MLNRGKRSPSSDMLPTDTSLSSSKRQNSLCVKPQRLSRSFSSIARMDESANARHTTNDIEDSPKLKSRSFYATGRKISVKIIGALRGKSRKVVEESREADRSTIGLIDEDFCKAEDSKMHLEEEEEEEEERRVKKGRPRSRGALRRILSFKGIRRLPRNKPLDEYAKRKLQRSRDSGWEGTSSSSSSSLSSLLAADPGFSTSSPIAKLPSGGSFRESSCSASGVDGAQSFSNWMKRMEDGQSILNSTRLVDNFRGDPNPNFTRIVDRARDTANSTKRIQSGTEDVSSSFSHDVDSGFGDSSSIVKMSFDNSFLDIWNSSRKMNGCEDASSSSLPHADSAFGTSSLILKPSSIGLSRNDMNSTKKVEDVQRTSKVYPTKSFALAEKEFWSDDTSHVTTKGDKIRRNSGLNPAVSKLSKSLENIEENIHASRNARSSEIRARRRIEDVDNLGEDDKKSTEEEEFSIGRSAESRQRIGQVARGTYWRFKRRGISKSAADLFEGSFSEEYKDDVTEFGSLNEECWCAVADLQDTGGSSRRVVMVEETTSRRREDHWEDDCPPGLEEQRASVFLSEEEEECLGASDYDSNDRSYVITMYV
ncbi:hypothetical protein KM043_014508 [Ampulex compressa]|nr:hypothetical protein KM043_014508 [Ampulex compressa]